VGRSGPLTPSASHVVLRAATPGDEALLLEWRNEPAVVRLSLTGQPVAPGGHATWLAARLASPKPRLWIAEELGEAVGQVRVDRDDETGTVSIAVATRHRGRGVGSRMLGALVAEMEADSEVKTLLAMVHPDNTASLHVFQRADFQNIGSRQGFVVFERSVEAEQ
jgi:UDP-2,4-diacetamido-2,4,6-trideoxy-beta-L-altropyranose hydrolase